MKIFISQGMQGKTNEEILNERNLAIEEIRKKFGNDVEIADEILFTDSHDSDRDLLWYLGESIQKISDVDIVYFCSNYEQYRGCRIVHDCAEAYGIPCYITN